MANTFTQNPFIVDTAWTSGTMPTDLTAQALGAPHQFIRIVWEGGTANDVATITDLAGNILFQRTCSVTGKDEVLWQNSNGRKYTMKQSKWIVSAIPHGKIFFYK